MCSQLGRGLRLLCYELAGPAERLLTIPFFLLFVSAEDCKHPEFRVVQLLVLERR